MVIVGLHLFQENLESKKAKLLEQISEASLLQANTDRRGAAIRRIVTKYLDEKTRHDFENYLSTLVAKITELKEMDQRVQLGEEQLVALNDSSSSSLNGSLCSLTEQ